MELTQAKQGYDDNHLYVNIMNCHYKLMYNELSYHSMETLVDIEQHTHTYHTEQNFTFSTTGLTTTPAPITLTGPYGITNHFITTITCETTSVFIGRS